MHVALVSLRIYFEKDRRECRFTPYCHLASLSSPAISFAKCFWLFAFTIGRRTEKQPTNALSKCITEPSSMGGLNVASTHTYIKMSDSSRRGDSKKTPRESFENVSVELENETTWFRRKQKHLTTKLRGLWSTVRDNNFQAQLDWSVLWSCISENVGGTLFHLLRPKSCRPDRDSRNCELIGESW